MLSASGSVARIPVLRSIRRADITRKLYNRDVNRENFMTWQVNERELVATSGNSNAKSITIAVCWPAAQLLKNQAAGLRPGLSLSELRRSR